MAIFHFPPAQTTGFAQPYGEGALNPSSPVPVNNPPFTFGGPVAEDAAIIGVAQPNPWSYIYTGLTGGGQPYGARKLCAALIGVRVDNPPFSFGGPIAEEAEIIGISQPDPWQYVYNGVSGGSQPYAPRRLSPAIPGQSVDQPPPTFGGPIAEDAEIIGLTQPDPWVYVYNGLAGGSQPYAPRRLSPAIPGQSADPPPFSFGGPVAEEAEIVGISQPDPWTYTFFGNTAPFAPKKLSPGIPGQSADKPPFKYGGPVAVNAEVVGTTQPDPWTYTFFGSTAPFAPKKLSPGIPGQSINNPPFRYGGPVAVNASIAAITQPDPWVYFYNGLTSGSQPYAPRKLPPTVTAVQVNNPPFTDGGRTAALAELVILAQVDPWSYPFVGGTQPYAGRNTVVQADPLSIQFPYDSRFAKIAASVIAIWQPDPWVYNFGGAQPYSPKQMSPGIPGQSLDPPPFDRRRSEQSAEAITLNQPEVWTYTFMGGAQPYAPIPVNPIFEGLITPPPGSGKRRNFPSYIPQPAYDEKPRKPVRPIWDRQRKKPEFAVAPIPALPPQEIFRGPPRVISTLGLPTFSEYTPPDVAGMARQMHEAHELADAHAAVRAMQAAQAQQANTDEQDMADVLAALRALGIIK